MFRADHSEKMQSALGNACSGMQSTPEWVVLRAPKVSSLEDAGATGQGLR